MKSIDNLYDNMFRERYLELYGGRSLEFNEVMRMIKELDVLNKVGINLYL